MSYYEMNAYSGKHPHAADLIANKSCVISNSIDGKYVYIITCMHDLQLRIYHAEACNQTFQKGSFKSCMIINEVEPFNARGSQGQI